MTADEIFAELTRLVREKLDHEGALAPDMRLVEDLELDSLRLMTLAVEVENHFRIFLDEEDEDLIETVGDLVGVVGRKLGQGDAETSGGS